MSAIVFAGPSLPPSQRPVHPQLKWRPPLRQGDLYEAALTGPALIGVIDGYFELVPAVWHKEILWAMAKGIHVYGSASIGALRAAELAEFGMKGVGHVYRQFAAGALIDDDEVALLHGPEEVDFLPVTEAMVNVRAMVHRARELGVLSEANGAELLRIAKSIFYKERTYDAILHRAAGSLPSDVMARFAGWLPRGQVDQKRVDAREMVDAMIAHLSRGVSPLRVSYTMAHTFAWEDACRRTQASLGTDASV
jgi:hypothetical protein